PDSGGIVMGQPDGPGHAASEHPHCAAARSDPPHAAESGWPGPFATGAAAGGPSGHHDAAAAVVLTAGGLKPLPRVGPVARHPPRRAPHAGALRAGGASLTWA